MRYGVCKKGDRVGGISEEGPLLQFMFAALASRTVLDENIHES